MKQIVNLLVKFNNNIHGVYLSIRRKKMKLTDWLVNKAYVWWISSVLVWKVLFFSHPPLLSLFLSLLLGEVWLRETLRSGAKRELSALCWPLSMHGGGLLAWMVGSSPFCQWTLCCMVMLKCEHSSFCSTLLLLQWSHFGSFWYSVSCTQHIPYDPTN